MTRKTHDICHPAGKYQSGGEEKTRWIRVGAVFMKDDGTLRIKMDAFPADCTDSGGWLACFAVSDREDDKPF